MNRFEIRGHRVWAFALGSCLCWMVGAAAAAEPVAWWTFDSATENAVIDRAAGRNDPIDGEYKIIRGAVGNALLLDGFTTLVERPAAAAPPRGGDFTMEAWVAQGAYPWNWCPIITQQRDEKAGYAFSVGPRGQIRLQVAPGLKFRLGHRHRLENSDLVVWLEYQAARPFEITLTPVR